MGCSPENLFVSLCNCASQGCGSWSRGMREWYQLPRIEETGIGRGTRELRNGWKVVGRGTGKGDPPATLPYVRKIERQAGSGRKRAKAEELPRRRCSHLSLVHPKSAFSTQQERQPISRRPELVCSTPVYVTPIQPGSEAHFAIFIMVVEAWDFSLSDSLVLKDARLLASWYSVEQVTKRGGRKQRGKPSRSLCHGSLPAPARPH